MPRAVVQKVLVQQAKKILPAEALLQSRIPNLMANSFSNSLAEALFKTVS
jgi:hypothetical protein